MNGECVSIVEYSYDMKNIIILKNFQMFDIKCFFNHLINRLFKTYFLILYHSTNAISSFTLSARGPSLYVRI